MRGKQNILLNKTTGTSTQGVKEEPKFMQSTNQLWNPASTRRLTAQPRTAPLCRFTLGVSVQPLANMWKAQSWQPTLCWHLEWTGTTKHLSPAGPPWILKFRMRGHWSLVSFGPDISFTHRETEAWEQDEGTSPRKAASKPCWAPWSPGPSPSVPSTSLGCFSSANWNPSFSPIC